MLQLVHFPKNCGNTKQNMEKQTMRPKKPKNRNIALCKQTKLQKTITVFFTPNFQ